jgi:hypothetical protein
MKRRNERPGRRALELAAIDARIFGTAAPVMRGRKMRRVGIITAFSMLLMALSASVALATTTIVPANGPTGAHFQAGTSAVCTPSGTTVNCSSYQVAGVGNANATASLTANYTANVTCSNNGTNPNNAVEAQATSFSTNTTTGNLSPKNGRLTVPALSTSAPTSPPAGSCPNDNWTATFAAGSPTLVGFTYTLTFVGFTGAWLTIT